MDKNKQQLYKDTCIAIRELYNDYTSAIVVYHGNDEDGNEFIKFTIVESKGEKDNGTDDK